MSFVVQNKVQEIFDFIAKLVDQYEKLYEPLEDTSAKNIIASEQLDKVTAQTEKATNELLDMADQMSEKLAEMSNQVQMIISFLDKQEQQLRLFFAISDQFYKLNRKMAAQINDPQLDKEAELLSQKMVNYFQKNLSRIEQMREKLGVFGQDIELLINDSFQIINTLQFQDITAQQISHANHLLLTVRKKLHEILTFFNDNPIPTDVVHEPKVAFDPNATIEDSDQRQALVEEIFNQQGSDS